MDPFLVIVYVLSICLITGIVSEIVCYAIFDKLRQFPGPRLAKWTSLSQLWEMYKSRNEVPLIRMHTTYGPIVRVAPNKLYFNDPHASMDMYSARNNFAKTDMYPTMAPTAYGEAVLNFFSSQDVKYHDKIRRLTSIPFANVKKHELAVDPMVEEFLQVIRDRFADKEIIDIGKWCTYFASDTVSKIMYGQSYGFMKAGGDVYNIMATNLSYGYYFHYIGMAPWLDSFLLKNPVLLWLQKKGWISSESAVFNLALKFMGSRLNGLKDPTKLEVKDEDMLDDFIRLSAQNPDVLNEFEIAKLSVAIILAGGDTTGSFLAALFFHLARNAQALKKLLAEIDEAPARPSYAEARKLEYLDACVLETKRMHSPGRLTFERVVPPQGCEIAGEHIPGGTIVAANAAAVNQNRAMYGEDVEHFRPERWLEATPEHRRMMERCLPFFSFGKYECIGRHIVSVEVMKLVPAFFREFTVGDPDPQQTFTVTDTSIAMPQDVKLLVRHRA